LQYHTITLKNTADYKNLQNKLKSKFSTCPFFENGFAAALSEFSKDYKVTVLFYDILGLYGNSFL
jgi:hypothetical protein